MSKEDKDKKPADIADLLNIRIFGLDIGELVKNLGVTDLSSLQDPSKAKMVKEQLEQQKEKLEETQEQLKKKFGDTLKVDYDIRISGLLGGKEGFRISSGNFFERLDELRSERNNWRTGRERAKVIPYRKKEGVIEPYIETSEDENYVQAIAELPGVEEKDIQVKVQEDLLQLEAITETRKYRGEIKLPVKVSNEPDEKSYVNGVLRLRFRKAQPQEGEVNV